MITVSGLGLSHGARRLFGDVTFRLLPGRRVALVGGNGVGKTTILEIVIGRRPPDEGAVHKSSDVRVGYLPQELLEAREGTVLDEVLGGAAELRDLGAELERLGERIGATSGDEQAAVIERYGDVQSRFEQMGGYSLDSEARRILAGLGFANSDMIRPLREMSGGWQMRAALARLMLAAPDVLVLDEPTNHLDTDSIDWLEQQLATYRGAVLFVSHDRDFIDAVAERVVEIVGGTATEYVGGFAEFVVQREERLAQMRAAADQQARRIEHTERFIERFRYKASKARQVQSRVKTLEKLERIEVPDLRQIVASFAFPEPRRSARVVVEVDDVTLGYGDDPDVLRDVDVVVERGAKVAVVGPNGAGKSTLISAILGDLTPRSGECRIGNNVDVAHFAQHQVDALDLSRTVYREFAVSAPNAGKTRNLRSVLGTFGFRGDAAERLVGELSGGERTRLALAKLMAEPVNLLVLDEPTNHLDLPSCDVLEDALTAYPGTVLLISHDRHLLRNTCTEVLEVRDGRAILHATMDENFLHPPEVEAAPAVSQRAAPSSRTASPRSTDGSTGAPASGGNRPSKAQRRQESAADRQRRSASTKELKNRVRRAERDLAATEARIAELSRDLADPEVYADAERVADLVTEFDAAKDRAATLMDQWESAQTRLDAALAELE